LSEKSRQWILDHVLYGISHIALSYCDTTTNSFEFGGISLIEHWWNTGSELFLKIKLRRKRSGEVVFL
jgi:hypothetical protein